MKGDELKKVRKDLALSIAKAARQCKLAARTWAHWESGAQRIPNGAVKLFRLLNETKGKQMNQAAQQGTSLVERQGIVQWAAQNYGVDAGKVVGILNATCFSQGKGEAPASDAEVASLMIVARAYGLNPFLKELFAFRDRKGGIVPVVGVDGWSRIINDKHEFDGVEFRYPEGTEPGALPAWVECVIHRKDRSHPTVVRELLAECRRDTGPWKSHPSRMLRHKALIQCARVAFGFAGIYDEDEADRIMEAIDITPPKPDRSAGAALRQAVVRPQEVPAREPGSDDQPEPEKAPAIEPQGPATAPAAGEATHTPAATAGGQGTPRLRKQFISRMEKCDLVETLQVMLDETRGFAWSEEDGMAISAAYGTRLAKLGK